MMQRVRNFITVVIPCYNHGAFIYETVNSVWEQTCKNYEIIIVDDGSDDTDTIDILDELARHAKITVLRKENGHVSSARNHGIKFSMGEFILTLDADDYFDPTFLEKAQKILQENAKIGVITCFAHTFDHTGITGSLRPIGGGIENFLTNNNCWASALFRYRCWEDAGGFNETMRRGYEDWDFWLSVTSSGWVVYSIPEYLYRYRNSLNSMVKQTFNVRPDLIKNLVENHEEIFKTHVVDVIYKKELMIQCLSEIKDTLTYRIGAFILYPIKFIRKGLKEYQKTEKANSVVVSSEESNHKTKSLSSESNYRKVEV
ncbi:MAG: glycosyltransferase family A protein [Balneolales bacterium]